MRCWRSHVLLCCLFAIVALPWTSHAASPPWVEVRSGNFSVTTDAGEKRGREVAQRFEQMRAAFGALFQRAKLNSPVPLQIVAFRSGKQLKQYGPVWKGRAVELAGFFQAGEDRNFIALDLSSEGGWGVVFHEYAHMLINGNMPPTPLWFDEGYAEYCSSLKVDGKYIDFGMPPEHLAQTLAQSGWMRTVDLFSVGHDSRDYNEGDRRSIFYAQSWLTVHYIMSQKKSKELKEYLELWQKRVPVADAVQQAFGIAPAQFDRTLRDYFHGRASYFRVPAPADIEGGPYQSAPLGPLQAEAILADLHYHTREHHEQGIAEFRDILKRDPDNYLANRGLGYACLRQNDFECAGEHFQRAAAQEQRDPRLHYFNAMLMSRREMMRGDSPAKLKEMRAELQKAIELDPNYADAYTLLAYTHSVAGDHEAALENARKAVELSPRNEHLLSNLANYQLRAEKWDEAAATLVKLKDSSNPQIAADARRNLEQLEALRATQTERTRLPARHEDGDPTAAQWRPQPATSTKQESTPGEALPQLDKRPIEFLKGRLVAVNCDSAGGATLNVTSGGKSWRMQVKDRGKLVLIGAEQFSCEWRNLAVNVNYRPSGSAGGDVVSLEVQ